MKTLVCAGLVLAATVLSPALTSSAAQTTTGVKVIHLPVPLEALAMSGNRVAFVVQVVPPVGKRHTIPRRVFVWNVGTGATTKVSGTRTASDGLVAGLAIAGARVAWQISAGSNSEGDNDLYASSTAAPRERRVRSVVRTGDACGAARTGPTPACAGTWLGGLVASRGRILVNRWTTDTTGAITGGGLYTLHGTRLTPFVNGGAAVEAAAADSHRIAVSQWRWYYPDPTISVYSARGALVSTVTPAVEPKQVALSGRNLLVLENDKLVLYDAVTGALEKTFTLHRGWQGEAIGVYGNVAVYSSPATPRPENTVRALNLTTGKDRLVGRLPGQIPLLRMNSFGLAYANETYTLHGYDVRLVFRPFSEVAALVR